ncbi:MAG: response regulator [Acidobacteriota bacterium]
MALSILIADDHSEVRSFVKKALESSGHSVSEADSGRSALALVESIHFDLIVTDIVMPDVEGLELIQRLKKTKPEIKIIAISGAFEGRFLKLAKLLGVKVTLEKPFSVQALLDAVTKACG